MNLQQIKDYFTGNQNDYSLISNSEMIRIGDILQGISSNNKVNVPNIVVVGTQSSGKSSVLNGIIGMDVLPTGKQMVTRTPLKIEIIRKINQDETIVELGDYIEGRWNSRLTQVITFPSPLPEEQQRIYQFIDTLTIEKAGRQKDISDNMIYLRIYSKEVTNLSLIDLPGLTAVACTDHGQPVDIKQKIEKLVEKYTLSDNTIILAILPGRSDLEADTGLEMVKKIDPNGERTVGVLTKLDLMNDDCDIIKYLENNVSKDLQLKYGYFAVRNRNSKEKEVMNVQEGITKEDSFFSNHPQLKKEIYAKKVGINSLKRFLGDILGEAIKVNLPFIENNIIQDLNIVQEEISKMGESIPDTEEGKLSYIQSLLISLCNDYNFSITRTGVYSDSGRNIRDIFIDFRNRVKDYNIFRNTDKITDKSLSEIINNSEGNHMSFPYPPVEIIERCLQDEKYRPIYNIYSLVKECNESITKELVRLIDNLIENSQIKRFSKLVDIIKKESVQSIIIPSSNKSLVNLCNLVKIQESYIWTDNKEFTEKLETFTNKDVNLVNSLRNLLVNYLDCIGEHFMDFIPKAIMYHLVQSSINSLYCHLYKVIIKKEATELLVEDTAIAEKRKNLVTKEKELIEAKTMIGNINSSR